MGCCKLTLFISALLAAWIGYKIYECSQPLPIPDLNLDQWWGPGEPRKIDPVIKPFSINIPEKVIANLKAHINVDHDLTPPLEDTNFEYGFNTNTLKKIIDFWKNKYDWKARQAFLNQFPQFKTNIQGLDIHFLHVKPKVDKNTKVLPLLMMHGWPGSIREFYEIIPKLTTKRPGYDFVFELIMPSLPGYGFSQAASKPGLGAPQVSIVFRNLMNRLGFKKYYVQGGDWGAAIGRELAAFFPNEVLGHHSNMCLVNSKSSILKEFLGSFVPSLFIAKEHESKIFPLKEHYENLILESGYMHIQATKPDTVGVALQNSPIGLAAYLLEKFTTWTVGADHRALPDGNLNTSFKYEDLLDNVMIYYVTGSITTSLRLYAESLNKAQSALQLHRIPILVPTACAKFPTEVMYQTDWQIKEKYVNLVQSTDMPRGGHFAAFEEPELLAADIFSAIPKFQEFNRKHNTIQKDEI